MGGCDRRRAEQSNTEAERVKYNEEASVGIELVQMSASGERCFDGCLLHVERSRKTRYRCGILINYKMHRIVSIALFHHTYD